jgi:hypothetical protein
VAGEAAAGIVTELSDDRPLARWEVEYRDQHDRVREVIVTAVSAPHAAGVARDQLGDQMSSFEGCLEVLVTNPNKIKGDKFELALREHCRAAGFDADRTRAGYARDHGDIHLAAGVSGPRVIVQAKNHREMRLFEWLREVAEQRDAAGAEHGFVVVKRPRVGDPGRQYAVLELDWLLALLREAGYGASPDSWKGLTNE